jgi:ferredoxin
MLAPQRTPEDRLSPKLKTHLATAAALNKKGVWKADAYAAPLAITFSDRTNAQGMRQHGCVECGDCSTGCNVGAKHSLDMNYLPLAWSGGAMMFTQTEVDRVERTADHYRVHCTLRSSRFSEATMASKLSQSRAARPMPPYTTSSSGRSATAGSRLLCSMRSAASVSQFFADNVVPVGA